MLWVGLPCQSSTRTLIRVSCLTCDIANGHGESSEYLLHRCELVSVNHNIDPRFPGRVIVSPARHRTRFYDLSPAELAHVFSMAAAIDRALTELYGSRRTMIASLGWNVDDHVHVHCVPTFHPTVTRGFENFGGAYEPPPHEVSRVVAEVRGYLASHAPPCG